MNRASCLVCLALLAGCTLPPERAAVKPLADDSPPQAYAELLTRARAQAASATESFYINAWPELEQMSRGLEQTSRFIPNAVDVPATHKDRLATQATALGSEARQLQDAAKARDEKKTNEVLQRINLLVRELRTEG